MDTVQVCVDKYNSNNDSNATKGRSKPKANPINLAASYGYT